jgi:hypothetical protein
MIAAVTNALWPMSAPMHSLPLARRDPSGGVKTDTDTRTINIAPVNDAAIDVVFNYTDSPGNSLLNGNYGTISATDPDDGEPATFVMASLVATTLSGSTATSFAGDIAVSSAGVV